MGKKSSSSAKTQITDYYCSFHYGVCHGPVDAVTGIYMRDKLVWTDHGQEPGWNINGAIGITFLEAFGGLKESGGVQGQAYVYLGGKEQLQTAWHASKVSRTPDNCPAYRGILSVFFTGPKDVPGLGPWGGEQYGDGCYVGSNDPSFPAVKIRVKRMSKGLDARFGTIAPAAAGGGAGYWRGTFDILRNPVGHGFKFGIQHWKWMGTGEPDPLPTVDGLPSPDGGTCVTEQAFNDPVFPTCVAQLAGEEDDSALHPDTNPAHMIFEALTDPDWGMGAPDTIINIPNFNDTAERLFNEGLGLSAIWTKQSSIEDFIGEILDHCQMMLFVHPRTGLFTLKMIRGDYDASTLRVVTPQNATLSNFQRKALGEITNEIVATFTNPVNEQDDSATFQALGEIAMQGGIVSDSRNYYMVRNATLAAELAARDLRTAASPLVSADLDLDRSFWDVVPGDVLRLHWPEHEIDDMVIRVGKINYGSPGNPRIQCSITEDVFALEPAQFFVPPASSWQDTSQEPRNFAFASVFTLPYPMLANLPDVNAGENYPGVYAGVMAAQLDRSTFSFEMTGEIVQANGGTVDETLGTKLQVGHVYLQAAIPAAATTTILFNYSTGGSGPAVAGFAVFGLGDDVEFAMIDAITDTGACVLARGVLDTVPRAWPPLTDVWFINGDFNAYDPLERTVGEEVSYRMQPRTSRGLLPIAAAEPESGVLTDRPYLPFRPANVLVDGVAFGKKTYADNPQAGVPVSWSNRNRTMEDTVVRRWSEGDVQPEPGQTTTIRVLRHDGTIAGEHADLAGTSFTLPLTSFDGEALTTVRVLSVRDGFESMQAAEILVEMPGSAGYGLNYGKLYGGTQ